MQVSTVVEQRLRQEIRAGLLATLGGKTDREAIMKTLRARKIERLRERYHDLSIIERYFMELVDIPVDWDNLRPVMRAVTTKHDRALWNYARNIVSSMPENSVIGRQMRYYFVDEPTGRWLGIVCLASALRFSSPRHQRLKWSGKIEVRNLVKIMNIAVCIPIQPFGVLCGGKLLFTSALSNTIREWYRKDYGDDLLAIETTSLYGKSSQYNRVREYQYLGLTKGVGNVHIPQDLMASINVYLSYRPELDNTLKQAGIPTNQKMRRVACMARDLNIRESLTEHGQRRGYYWGITAENSEDILTERTTGAPKFFDRTLSDLADFWQERWYNMRLPKKQDYIRDFDPEMYRLDNHLPIEMRGDRQLFLL